MSQSQKINYEEKAQLLFQEQNKIRTDPKSYISKLQSWLPKFRDNTLYLLKENPLKTFEGKHAIEEAIRFLSKQNPLPPLVYSEALSKAASDHIKDIGEKGLTSHEGSNGETVSDRIEKYTEWDGSCAENIDFGFTEPENIIMNLLIDDGVDERYQRSNLFSSVFKQMCKRSLFNINTTLYQNG